MADIKKPQATEPQVKNRTKKISVMKIFLVVLVLIILLGCGVAAGIYLKFIDIADLAQKHKMYDYPVVGKYFPRKSTNFDLVDLDSPTSKDEQQQSVTTPNAGQTSAPETLVAAQPLNQPTNAEEMAKIMEKAKQDEAKRLSKTARLLGTMKSDEAAVIINQLDNSTIVAIFNKMDEEQVAKIMAQLGPEKAASLTKMMLKGN
ncbi:MAG: MgtE intracellular domain protein [Firmicutes bacterium]|nr:MgtE intracellular domain protein [Bacillota bacterium]